MKSSEYLYGVSSTEWAHISYEVALKKRIGYAKTLLKVVTNELDKKLQSGKTEYKVYSRLNEQQKAIQEAISFNEKLLDELKE